IDLLVLALYRVARRELALLDRDVHQQVATGHVTDREYSRIRGPHRRVDLDPGVRVRFDAGIRELESLDIRDTAECLKDLIGLNAGLLALGALVDDALSASGALGADHLGAGNHANPFFAQVPRQRVPDVVVDL